MGEETESFDVEIMDDGSVVRTIRMEDRAVYTASQQIADFGSPQASIAVRINPTRESESDWQS